MALTYAGTDVSAVKDKPTGYSQSPIAAPAAPNYTRTYPISIAKTSVDTTATGSTNFTALVAAIDAAVDAQIASDFDQTVNTITASGRLASVNLIGGSKYINTTNTSSYEVDVVASILVVII